MIQACCWDVIGEIIIIVVHRRRVFRCQANYESVDLKAALLLLNN